jgi:hypothetical protein
MTNIVFCHTNQHYDSYTDYWRLVELAGYPVCSIDDIDKDDPDTMYIVSPVNGNIDAGWPDATAQIVLWNLEWIAPPTHVPGVAQIWTSDKWYAGQSGSAFVPLGSHADLTVMNEPDAAQWDVCLLAYREPHRRRHVIRLLQECGLSIAPDGWGETREETLRHSRIMVHIHQHDTYPCVPAQRFALAAAARIPLLSEECHTFAPFTDHDLYRADYGRLVDAAVEVLKAPAAERFARAYSMHERACGQYEFKLNVECAVQALLEGQKQCVS